jgi:hypothetical protein
MAAASAPRHLSFELRDRAETGTDAEADGGGVRPSTSIAVVSTVTLAVAV